MFFGHNDPTNAAAAFDKDLVIQCCENFLAKREARIQRDIDKACANAMTDYRSWLGRLFRTRGPATTHEEALERVKEVPKEFLATSIWWDIHYKGSSTAELVENILRMTENTNLPYVVLTDSGQFILNYKDNT